jgi:hypothetical protein
MIQTTVVIITGIIKMTEAQGVLLLTALAEQADLIRITQYFISGLLLAVVWAATWRG